MKILVIGATHAGTFATQQILTEHPDYDVTVYERNHNLSFLSCGIALWVGDHVSDPEKMFYSSPEALAALGANMQMEHEIGLHNWFDADRPKHSGHSRHGCSSLQKLA